jgi:hypothetical protein
MADPDWPAPPTGAQCWGSVGGTVHSTEVAVVRVPLNGAHPNSGGGGGGGGGNREVNPRLTLGHKWA